MRDWFNVNTDNLSADELHYLVLEISSDIHKMENIKDKIENQRIMTIDKEYKNQFRRKRKSYKENS